MISLISRNIGVRSSSMPYYDYLWADGEWQHLKFVWGGVSLFIISLFEEGPPYFTSSFLAALLGCRVTSDALQSLMDLNPSVSCLTTRTEVDVISRSNVAILSPESEDLEAAIKTSPGLPLTIMNAFSCSSSLMDHANVHHLFIAGSKTVSLHVNYSAITWVIMALLKRETVVLHLLKDISYKVRRKNSSSDLVS